MTTESDRELAERVLRDVEQDHCHDDIKPREDVRDLAERLLKADERIKIFEEDITSV